MLSASNVRINKAQSSDTEALFLDLNLSNSINTSRIFDKWDDFNFDIVSFPFLEGNISYNLHEGWHIYLSSFICQSI